MNKTLFKQYSAFTYRHSLNYQHKFFYAMLVYKGTYYIKYLNSESIHIYTVHLVKYLSFKEYLVKLPFILKINII